MDSHNEKYTKNSNILKFQNLVLMEYLLYKRHLANHILVTYSTLNPFFPEKKLTSLVLITKLSLSFSSDLKIKFYFSALILEGIVGI